ncbi:hypothetical protein Tco_0386722 [Tanacetum coccineum]
MNLGTSSQPQQLPQHRLSDTPPNSPPHSPTQSSHYESEYNRQATVQRTKDMITGKWTTLTRDCNKFAGIVEEHARLSAWDVLKNHHKWRGVKAVVPGRRVRTAEDIEEPNELFRGDTIPRPPGKPRPTKSQKSDSSRSAGSSSTGGEAFKEMVQEELRIKRQFFFDILDIQKKFEELKFLNFNTEGMSPKDAANIE